MKRKALLLTSILAILMLTLLAAGLSDLKFAPAHSGNLGGEEVRPINENLTKAARGFEESPLWKQGLLVGGFFLALLLALIFMPAEVRKAFFKRLLWLGFFAIIVFIFIKPSESDVESNLPEEILSSAYTLEMGEETVGTPPEIYQPPEVSPIWGYLITTLILLIIAILLWWLWRVWNESRQVEELPQKKLQRIVQASLDDLAEGAALDDVIIRSYLEMGEVVNERRGIARDVEMTPHEFALRLVSAGLPANPVRELTRLFERARYSPHSASEREIATAVNCLHEIASVFGKKL